jgi:hypothetical protein
MPSRAPSSRLFFALLGGLALAIAGWSLFWFTARQAAVAALAEVDATLAREGWQRTCAAEAWGGYPFRLGFSCTGLTLKGPDTTLTLPQVAATMRVHDPATVIVTATAPLSAATPEGIRTVGFEAARAALRLADPAAPVVETRLTAPTITVENGPVLGASALDVTVRPAPDAVGVTLALADPAITAPVELRAARIAIAGALKPPPQPAPTAEEFLRRAGGQRTALDLESLVVEGEGFAVSGSGTLALTPEGFVDGKVRVEATGPGAVADRLKDAGALPDGDGGVDALAAMLSAIGSTALTVTVKNGAVSVGPFRLGRLPPVF